MVSLEFVEDDFYTFSVAVVRVHSVSSSTIAVLPLTERAEPAHVTSFLDPSTTGTDAPSFVHLSALYYS